nr:ATP-binding protein [Novosphingobium profundi]
MVVPADLASVRALAEHLRQACSRAGIDDMALFELELALVEAANNIVEHGYVGQDAGSITLAIAIESGRVHLTLTDTGSPVPPAFFANTALPEGHATSGRGAAIIHGCTDEVAYESRDGVNRLVLTKGG